MADPEPSPAGTASRAVTAEPDSAAAAAEDAAPSPTAEDAAHVDSDSTLLAQPDQPADTDAPIDIKMTDESSPASNEVSEGHEDDEERVDDDDDAVRTREEPSPSEAPTESGEAPQDSNEQAAPDKALPETAPFAVESGPESRRPEQQSENSSDTLLLSPREQEAALTPIEEMQNVDLSEDHQPEPAQNDEEEVPAQIPALIRPELAALRSETQRDQDDLVADTPIVQPVTATAAEGPRIEIEAPGNAPDDIDDELEELPPSVVPTEVSGPASSEEESGAAEECHEATEPAQETSQSESPAAGGSAAPTVSISDSAAEVPAVSAPLPTTAAAASPSPDVASAAPAATPAPAPTARQPRRESMASVTTVVSAPGSTHLVSGILIVSSLETIAASKEAKKSKPLKDALDAALESLKSTAPPTTTGHDSSSALVDPHVVFLPLRLACETKSLPLMITALDCLGKLVSYDFFTEPHDPAAPQLPLGRDDDNESLAGGGVGHQPGIESLPLADQITSTVCDCFSPSPSSSSSSSSSSSASSAATTQHDTLLLRLLSCLLGLILSSSLPIHQSALLKAVRTVYNVFLLGRPGTVQTVAQATLGQIVGGVFGRITFSGEAVPAGGVEARGLGAGAAETGGDKTTPVAPSRSQSRTDLASVAEAEETEDDCHLEPAEHRANGCGGLASGARQEGDDGTVPASADARASEGAEQVVDPTPTTPRVSVTDETSVSEETAAPPTESAGERVTRCGSPSWCGFTMQTWTADAVGLQTLGKIWRD